MFQGPISLCQMRWNIKKNPRTWRTRMSSSRTSQSWRQSVVSQLLIITRLCMWYRRHFSISTRLCRRRLSPTRYAQGRCRNWGSMLMLQAKTWSRLATCATLCTLKYAESRTRAQLLQQKAITWSKEGLEKVKMRWKEAFLIPERWSDLVSLEAEISISSG